MKTSPLFTLNWNDLLKGLFVAVGSSIVSVVMADINAGKFAINWTAVWHGAIVGAVSYLGKNFFTPQQTIAK